MTRLKAATASCVLALCAGSIGFAQTVYVPPGDAPRFGGEFKLTDVGPVAGYWQSQCYNWHVRSSSRRTGPVAAPQVDATFKRFVSGLIARKPEYGDFSPAMAEAVRKNLPLYWPSINRMGHASIAKSFDTDKDGNTLYILDLAGGSSHWDLTVNADGKIDSAFMCEGTGL
jgi:hypothetical protein